LSATRGSPDLDSPKVRMFGARDTQGRSTMRTL
jgi:hypothetical protein